ncbi:response regulator transcription factor [Singulisphaera rosea]
MGLSEDSTRVVTEPGEASMGRAASNDARVGPEMGHEPISVLLVDDDLELCELMQEFFGRRNLRLEIANDAGLGLARALKGGHDLVLLDVMMPGTDGFELLRHVRRQSLVPVIMLTARTSQVDRVAGLDAGADDYLPKPFGPEELLARIRAVLRRSRRAPERVEVLETDGIKLIPSAREVLCEGTSVPVTAIEYDILEALVRSAGRTVTREELTTTIYRRKVSPFDRAIDMHVSNLRKKLGARSEMIHTVRGTGYLFRAGLPDRAGR